MKKHKDHIFNVRRFITDKDECILCNNSGEKLFININEKDCKILKNILNSSYGYDSKEQKILAFQINWLKDNTKCITEEEFIIKNLLE
jgi:hypothetical protein